MSSIKSSSFSLHTDEYDHLIKLLVIGDSGVGKSSMMMRFADDQYTDTYISTIGVDFKVRTIEIDGKIVKLQIWDTAGQERFRSIVASYYRGTYGILLCYSITDRQSFENLEKWLKDCHQYALPNVKIILCGLKCDCDNKRIVSYDEGKLFAENHGFKFIETSAKNDIHISDAFEQITRESITEFGNIISNSQKKNISSSNSKKLLSNYNKNSNKNLIDNNKTSFCNII